MKMFCPTVCPGRFSMCRLLFRISVFVFCVSFLAACQAPPPDLTGAGMNMFAPVKMRLHPLSRIIPGDKTTPASVEARLEFTDQFGDVTKTPGTLYFELFTYEILVPAHKGERILLANFDLNTPTANKEHWDPITRTYLFKLTLKADALKEQKRLILSATATLPNGVRLKDDLPTAFK